jgi:hypothetical protein
MGGAWATSRLLHPPSQPVTDTLSGGRPHAALGPDGSTDVPPGKSST